MDVLSAASEPPPRPLRLVRPGLCALLAALLVFLTSKAEWRHGVAFWWSAEKLKLELLVQGGWWWGAVGVTGLAGLLLATSPWWCRDWRTVREDAPGAATPRWFILAVTTLMLAGALSRAPRLDLSFYNDEAHAFRSHIAGRLAVADAGKPEKFRPATWLTTLYENRAGNNAMPYSIAARISYDAWLRRTGQARGTVNEAAVRLPVFCCGVLSIGAMAWLALRLGGPWMGLAAALLTAFHPWHLRYSVEARGYGMLFLVLPLLLLALHTAWRSGRWRWWLVFGVLEYLAVAVWFGSAHLLVALNCTLAATAIFPALRSRHASDVQTSLLFPVIVAGCLALALYLQFNLPLYIQLAKSLADPLFFKTPHPFPIQWFQDAGGFLGFGAPGLALNPANSTQPAVAGWLADPWWRFPAGATIVILLIGLAVGVWRFIRSGGTAAALTGATVGGAFLTWFYCTAKGIVFLKWYSLFLLPGLLLLLAGGLTHGMVDRRSWWRPLLLLPLGLCWARAIPPYLTQSRENLRGAVAIARAAPYPESLTNPRQTLYAVLWSESPIYDPASLTLKTRADLEALVARARQENRPLFISHGHSAQALVQAPEIIARLRDPAVFQPLPPLPGLDDASTTHFVYQLIP